MRGKRTRRRFVWILLCAASLGSKTTHAEDPVHFEDALLKLAVEQTLGVSNPTPTDMLGLTSLTANYCAIVNLVGLEYAVNLETLTLNNNEITDVSPVTDLTHLRSLNLHENRISDLSPLTGLTNLQTLSLGNNQISEASAITGLTNLE